MGQEEYLVLQDHLRKRFEHLKGDWVSKRSNYDEEICHALEMEDDKRRYWDARWKEYFIEFKKGKSDWIDLVRYAEILLRENEEACRKTITMFFMPYAYRNEIEKIICVETEKLIAKMGLTEYDAKALCDLSKRVLLCIKHLRS